MSEKQFRSRKVFISYWREGGQAHALNFHQGLIQVLSKDAVYLDVTLRAMEVGQPWREVVREKLSGCDTLLLILDPGLVKRLQDPGNAVRFELETALQLGVRVVPVRVDKAIVPGATELPESLSHLPDLHSPEVHHDVAIADVDRIIEWMTGIAPGTVKPLDRWDIAIISGLAIFAILVWLSWARELFSVGEAWLWGGALLIPWFMWMLVRRWIFIRGDNRSIANRRQTLAWFVVLVVFGAAWGVAWVAMYSVPQVSDWGGVLVSRLENDPRDKLQSDLIEYFQPDVQITEDVPTPSSALPLPRRVGFVERTNPWLRDSRGHDEARRFGGLSGAAIVLWGEVFENSASAQMITANLTFIGTQTVFKRSKSNVTGLVKLREQGDIKSNLAVLGETLPLFLDGYRAFYQAEDDGGFNLALSKFEHALNTIDDLESRASNASALSDIRATILFYLGNIEYILERPDTAALRFKESMDETSETQGGVTHTRFVHAANNLGWMQIRDGKYLDAIATFETAQRECAPPSVLRACAYAWYNRGDAEAWLHNFAKAEEQFERAIERITDRGIDITDWTLEAQSHQYLAYTLVRQAAFALEADKNKLLARAENAWHKGVEVYETYKLSMPEHHGITLARIHIERGECQKAIDLLLSLDVPDLRITVESLLAAVYALNGEADRQFASITAMTVATDVQTPIEEAWEEMARIEANCRCNSTRETEP